VAIPVETFHEFSLDDGQISVSFYALLDTLLNV